MKTKSINLPVILILMCLCLTSQAQDKKSYTVSGVEWIFSFADITEGSSDVESVLRFSPVINLQTLYNYDASDRFGVFIGLAVRNVGFIYDVPNSNERKKVRTYNVGIPLGIKLGDLEGFHFYGGYELELPVNYKEKTFVNDDKTNKFNTWFTDRTPTFSNAVFAGVQLPRGASIKFKYYLNNFYKKSYSEEDANGNPVQPYQNLDVNVFYISLNFFVLQDLDVYYSAE
jgi:hypothetical protein